jgi:predicted transcriptional regulator
MPTTAKDTVVSVRLDVEALSMLDDLAEEMDRSRSYLIGQAVREFVEREYASLAAIRESERELAEGKGIPHEKVSMWVDDLIAGKGRPKGFR